MLRVFLTDLSAFLLRMVLKKDASMWTLTKNQNYISSAADLQSTRPPCIWLSLQWELTCA